MSDSIATADHLPECPLRPADDNGTPQASARVTYIINVVRAFLKLWLVDPPFIPSEHHLEYSYVRPDELAEYTKQLDVLQKASDEHGLNDKKVGELRELIEGGRVRGLRGGLLDHRLESGELSEYSCSLCASLC